MRGPIDYIVVGFEGDKFDGSVLGALSGAIDTGVIRLVALSFIKKDAEGNVVTLDLDGTDDESLLVFIEKYKADEDLVTQEDIDEVAELVEPNTAVGLLVIEQLWAIPLKQALVNARGVLVAEGRIHPDAAAELNEEEEK